MGWHGVANAVPGEQDAISMPTLRIFLQFSITAFTFAAKERSPKILVEISLGLCNIQGNSIFSYIHFINFTLYIAFYIFNI